MFYTQTFRNNNVCTEELDERAMASYNMFVVKKPVMINGRDYGIVAQNCNGFVHLGVFVSFREYGRGHAMGLVSASTGLQRRYYPTLFSDDDIFKYDSMNREKFLYKKIPLNIHRIFINILKLIQGEHIELEYTFEKRLQKASIDLWGKLYKVLGKKEEMDKIVANTKKYFDYFNQAETGELPKYISGI